MEGSVIELSKYRFETFIASKAEAKKQIDRAEEFTEAIRGFLAEKGVL